MGFTFSSASVPARVWFEGNAFAAIAYQLLGETVKAQASLQLLERGRLQGPNADPSGRGLIAASHDDLRDASLDTAYDARLAVAPTAWALMASSGSNPFNLVLPTPFQQWQVTHFGSTNNPAAAPGFDADGDHMTNQQEFMAGTNPNDPNSLLRVVRVSRSGSDSVISFSTVTNKNYALEYRASFGTHGWTNLLSNLSGNGGIVVVTNSGAALPAAYYRVRLEP